MPDPFLTPLEDTAVSQILFTTVIYLIPGGRPPGTAPRRGLPPTRPFRAYLGLLGGGGYHVPPAPLPAPLVSMALL